MRSNIHSSLTTLGKITVTVIVIILFVFIIIKFYQPQRKDVINNLTLIDTVSIFLLKNEKGSFFCIPIQYMGNYHISSFEYSSGIILLQNYNIPINRSDITIYIYLNEEQNEIGSSIDNFNLLYHEEKGKIIYNSIAELITRDTQNHYYIFIEKHLSENEIQNINKCYSDGNTKGSYSIWYNITIDDEVHNGSGLQDNFELHEGEIIDMFILPNLNFFRDKYLNF